MLGSRSNKWFIVLLFLSISYWLIVEYEEPGNEIELLLEKGKKTGNTNSKEIAILGNKIIKNINNLI